MNYRCISPSDGEGGAILPVAHGCGDISKVVSLLARHLVAGALRAPGMVFCSPASRGAQARLGSIGELGLCPAFRLIRELTRHSTPLCDLPLGEGETTGRILLHGQPSADCDFNLAALHSAYPIKRRTSAQRTQASQGVEIRKKLAPLTHWRTISASRASCEDRRAKGQSRNSHEQALESAGVEASVQRSARGWIA
jgi:hypothetical protein